MAHDRAEIRRKRLLFRCQHRGFKEADLLLGGFAESHLAGLSDDQLTRLEALLGNNDPDIYAWISGQRPVPQTFDSDVMALLKDFAKSSKPL